MDLFLDQKKLTFEKVAREVRLPEDVNEWPQYILDQLYQQAPYASRYAPRVVLRDIDPDKRYALGYVELINKLAINPRDDDTPPQLKGRQRAIVPILVKAGKLYPLDLLVSGGKIEPLTEERLRRALFRPELFEAVKTRPGDLSMIEQLYPPNRQFGGARGPLITDAGSGEEGIKVSHPRYLLDAILHTVKLAHVHELQKELSDPVLRAAYAKNPVAQPFLAKIAAVENGLVRTTSMTSEDFLKTAAEAIEPTVVQIRKIDGGFRVKMANSKAILPVTTDLTRAEALQTLGKDVVTRVERDGTTTVTTQPAVKQDLEDFHVQTVEQFGLYKVQTVGENKELVGWVFPYVVGLNGEVLPLAVFGNGSQSAIQDTIAGILVARQTDIINSAPHGFGMFYVADKEGATGIVPLTVDAQQVIQGQEEYACTTILGERCVFVKVPGIETITPVAPGRYAIPEDACFLPLPDLVDLVSDAAEFVKVSEASAYSTAVRVITDGTTFSFEGAPIDKIASAIPTKFLDLDDAVFLGTLLGSNPTVIKTACLGARKLGQEGFWFKAGPVETLKSKYAAAKEEAKKLLTTMPDLRAVFVKEASQITDPAAIDAVLSIGFLNPENLTLFVEYTPELEDAINKLSELLLASRLGLSAVDSSALERVLVHLDKVVTGLKSLTGHVRA